MDPRKGLMSLVVVSMVVSSLTEAWAETYVAAQLGASLPQQLTNTVGDENTSYPNPPTSATLFRSASVTDTELKNSPAFGIKIGHYFESLRWLGVETEVLHATPDFKEQIITLSHPGFGSFKERQLPIDIRVITWAFNALARYPGQVLEPYAGVGLGIFFVNLSGSGTSCIDPDVPGDTGCPAPDFSTSSTRLGLNTQLGLRYHLSKKLGLFGEWKLNRVGMKVDQIRSLLDVSADYNAHHLLLGVGYHF